MHKASGRAVVRIQGRDIYLGPYGSEESHDRYQRFLAEWRVRRAESRAAAAGSKPTCQSHLTISEVLLRYREFAGRYYSKDGRTTKEFTEMAMALKPMRELYGSTSSHEFGPLKLKAVRQVMIENDLSRGVINHRINRIKRFFRWAVSEELIPSSVYEGLRTVDGLKKGRSTARETEPVLPVADEHVEAVLPHVCKRRWESVALGGRKVQRSGCGRSSWERGWRLATRRY
jgi:hypothetical protein